MTVLMVHGGGDNAYHFDLEILKRLRVALGTEVAIEYPRIAGLERIEWASTSAELSKQFANLAPSATVVAHSVGGAAALKILSDSNSFPVANLFLLAPPYKAADSHWGNTIPVDEALLYKQKLPSARVRLLHGYGHQFSGPLDFLASDIRSAIRHSRHRIG
jgi:uncharacterized protein